MGDDDMSGMMGMMKMMERCNEMMASMEEKAQMPEASGAEEDGG